MAVDLIPTGRWLRGSGSARDGTGDGCRHWGGLLSAPFPWAFDAAFFGVPPTEAEALDPQQRLLLETAWRACEDAGLVPDPNGGRPVGVFVGISTADFGARLWESESAAFNPFTATGVSFAAAAGRLSYTFGFEGPCLAIDTACSSSLVAVHQACNALRMGECEAALVAGVNALLTPHLYGCLGRMGLLSAEGRCKAFDASGDGYVRAEGCGAVVLKMAERARQDGDRILALLCGTAVNQDGRSNGLTAPNRLAQVRVIERALAAAGLSTGDVDYVEAHGTGTPLGDVIELGALIDTYGAGRDRLAPLLVGSVKTNIGHLEAGAGMAGLIKAILSVQHGEIAPHLHLTRPTPRVNWAEAALRVPTQLTPWPAIERPRRAAVSAFGFSGTNAHVIVEEVVSETAAGSGVGGPVLLPLSARTPAALDTLAATLADWLEATPCSLADVGLTLATRRTVFANRRAVVGATPAELAARLRNEAPPQCSPPGGDPNQRKLEELARLWAEGGEIDWARLYGSSGARMTSLPGHPFQRQRYWPDPVVDEDRPPQPVTAVARQRAGSLRAFIDERARRVLSDEPLDPLDPDLPLLEQGFTSLAAMELGKILERDLGTTVPSTFLFNYPTINSMAAFFTGEVAQQSKAEVPELPPSETAHPEYDYLDDLSEEDLEVLIDREVSVP
jgi:acyl transferase domain-containing protein